MTSVRLSNSMLLCISVGFLGLAILGCGEGKTQGGGRPGGTGAKLAVDAVVIRPQPLENKINATGTLLANEEVELRPEISGRITGISFAEGGKVHKGQVLLKINDSELQAQYKGKQLAEKLAADEERRKQGLLDINGISQEDYDRAANNLKMIQAEREVIESQLAKTEIVAPFDGVVGLRYVSEGSYVTSAMLVATMQDIDPIKIEFSVPEKYARQITKGTTIVVTAGELDTERQGTIFAVESKIDPKTRTIKARASVPNPDAALIPGSFVKVEITLERLPDALVVPAGVIIPELAGEKVFVVRNGQARSVLVKVGLRTETSVQIVEGLQPDDTILTTGLLQVVDGRAIEIRNLQGN
ncbi:MAG: efflux RND transporter periplasmic adaptor subunit [Candidatus Zixiibacteriota bacterium]